MAPNIRNIAIIAHVDHGKTTLVDGMLKQSGIFHENEVVTERVMDSNPLERERGITILAKNTAVIYKNTKINIVDTPGHADFGGEVERALSMVDGVLLIVDAFEGPMPQTKFVLKKALELNLQPVVVVNKIDRADARAHEVIDEVFDLFLELGANEEQLDFPIVYTSARAGLAKREIEDDTMDLEPLFEVIISHVAPPQVEEGPFQMLVANLDHDSYLGKYAIGKINRGTIKAGDPVALIRHDGTVERQKISKTFVFQGLKKLEVASAAAGEIVALAGIDDVNIGETLADVEQPDSLPVITVDEPTLTMTFSVNNSPFAGQEGTYVTSRKLRERLYKELDSNVSLRVEDTDSTDAWQVSGRGELHLSILIENMRREGYELQVSKPEVIYKRVNNQLLEPIEHLMIDIPEDAMGPVMENLGRRKAEMVNMISSGTGSVRLEFKIPARGLIGFRSELLTQTRGNGIMNHLFDGYRPYKGDISTRYQGSLIAWEDGEATAYGLLAVEDRGILFVVPGTKVYEGMVVGVGNREQDIEINVCKKKHLTNMRSSTADETVKLKEPRLHTLEEAIEFINDDELVEVTPKSIRIRKKYLKKNERVRAAKEANNLRQD
ncbi:translational GTPase TypA [Candidatus Formimonas warabiya]|uniref:Large ribosomal subunit assembly factor BipA n=1 Tax=Formimonas warabiya TaxID=1761012 RepID=A0A3G1KV82_FORW1|nr:translational GTPase TypA [Candidatus Formimonas warabiya]ATW26346.1 GTP-binding protein TypA [Candidatus Formimonas warabiya]